MSSNFPTSTDNLTTTHQPFVERIAAATINNMAAAVNSVQLALRGTALANAYNVLDYGALVGGAGDNTTAFQNALTAAGNAHGGVVVVPVAVYNFASSGALTVPDNVVLTGAIRGPFHPSGLSFTGNTIGPTLLVNNSSVPFLTVGTNSAVENLLFHYPGQVLPTATSPNVFPATITNSPVSPSANSFNMRFRGLTSTNAYDFISVGSTRSLSQLHIEDCCIGAMHTGITIDHVIDYSHIYNLNMSPLWDWTNQFYSYEQNIDTWMDSNSTAILIHRADDLYLDDIGIFGGKTGIHFGGGVNDAWGYRTAYARMTNISCDNQLYGLVVDDGGPILVSNFMCAPRYAGVYLPSAAESGIAAPNPIVSITNGKFWNTPLSYVTAKSGSISIDKMQVTDLASVAALVTAGTPRLRVTNSDFTKSGMTIGSLATGTQYFFLGNSLNGNTAPSTAGMTNPQTANNMP